MLDAFSPSPPLFYFSWCTSVSLVRDFRFSLLRLQTRPGPPWATETTPPRVFHVEVVAVLRPVISIYWVGRVVLVRVSLLALIRGLAIPSPLRTILLPRGVGSRLKSGKTCLVITHPSRSSICMYKYTILSAY